MHELAITEGLLQVANDSARQAGARRVTHINVVIGDLSSVVDESVQFYADILSRGTPAAGARLCFRRVPAQLTCDACQYRGVVEAPLVPVCPRCGGCQLQVEGGRELYVESIEVDDADRG